MIPSAVIGLAPAPAAANRSVASYYAATAACDKAIEANKVIPAKIHATCKNGVVDSPNPCPNGKPGQLEQIGKREYVLHIGHRPVRRPKNPTQAQANKGC